MFGVPICPRLAIELLSRSADNSVFLKSFMVWDRAACRAVRAGLGAAIGHRQHMHRSGLAAQAKAGLHLAAPCEVIEGGSKLISEHQPVVYAETQGYFQATSLRSATERQRRWGGTVQTVFSGMLFMCRRSGSPMAGAEGGVGDARNLIALRPRPEHVCAFWDRSRARVTGLRCGWLDRSADSGPPPFQVANPPPLSQSCDSKLWYTLVVF